MGIQDHVEHAKVLFNQGVDLLLLRAQLLNVDLAEQAENTVRMLVAGALAVILLLVALISLLFGLNRILDDMAAVWVFFGISGVCVLAIVGMVQRVWTMWCSQHNQITTTLSEIQTDIAYLRGQYHEQAEKHHE